jgi:hypothetical protein
MLKCSVMQCSAFLNCISAVQYNCVKYTILLNIQLYCISYCDEDLNEYSVSPLISRILSSVSTGASSRTTVIAASCGVVGSLVTMVLVAIFACFYMRKSHQNAASKSVHSMKDDSEPSIVSDVPGVVLMPSEKEIKNSNVPGPSSELASSPSHIRYSLV